MMSLAARISSKSPSLLLRVPVTLGREPETSATISARSVSSCLKAPPTVPLPRMPTLTSGVRSCFFAGISLDVPREQVVPALAADHHSGLPFAAEDHRRPRHPVVVARH